MSQIDYCICIMVVNARYGGDHFKEQVHSLNSLLALTSKQYNITQGHKNKMNKINNGNWPRASADLKFHHGNRILSLTH